jgi:hypothetical protein
MSGLNLQIDAAALKPLIAAIVAETIAAVEARIAGLDAGRVAYTEPEAAAALGLQASQLRGEREMRRVRASVGPAGRILYTREALVEYLASRPWPECARNGNK